MSSPDLEMELRENGIEVMEPTAHSLPPEQLVSDYFEKKDEEANNSVFTRRQFFRCSNLMENLFSVLRPCEKLWLPGDGDYIRGTGTYQVWPGKNVFFFQGRLVCDPDPRGLLLTTFSILISSWIFVIYVADDLPSHSTLVVIFSVILTVIVLVNLVLVSAIDPGIIPRNCQEFVEMVDGTREARRRKKRVKIDAVEFKLKYCRTCNIFRPPRTSHCEFCNDCVEKFDPYCPWVGQCIALRNYRFYLCFVLSALVYFMYISVFCCWRIKHRVLSNGSILFGMLRNYPETSALLLFSFVANGFIGGLAIYHLHLVAINHVGEFAQLTQYIPFSGKSRKTAYENFRFSFVGSRNPFDKGFICNLKEVMFTPLPPSRVDFLAEVTSSCCSYANKVGTDN